VDLAPPSLDPEPAPTPPTPPPGPPPGPPAASDHILGGVAALLAARLGIDALWLRIAFVLLAIVGGVGVLLYLGLWLVLVRGADHPMARVAGGVLLVGGLPFLLQQNGDHLVSGGWAVFVLLVGLALALWQPRRAPGPLVPAAAAPPAPPAAAPAAHVEADSLSPRPQAPRLPSVLGRTTLGVAAVVAAGGALIDQANGGRLHPEQWLGAAAAVCGIGLLVGAVMGRARWLAVPAVLLAGTGVVAGESARLGLDATAFIADEDIYVDTDTTAGAREHVVLGSVDVEIGGAPRQPIVVDARVAVGDVRIHVPGDVTVEVRADGDDVQVDGIPGPDGTFTVGPEGPADVVVDARVGYGDIDVDHRAPDGPRLDLPVPMVVGPARGTLRGVADGVAIATDGSIALADGEALVDNTGRVVVGDAHREGNVTVITTSTGDFKLLPGDLLLTPFGELLDLTDLRATLAIPPTTGG
jgi:phage shock protein PspC (stress-responsive transcriptional regulator)